ncbi:MAG: LacI family DNA-binding transcriptional regulator [Aggregatilineales bacterium]
MGVTLKDIAEKSGFSITTVSRALGGFDDVNEDTRKLITQIANEMGYQPNLIARQLRDKRTHTIGIITPMSAESADDDFFNILIKGIAHAASEYHYDLLISAQLPSADEMDAYRRIAGGNRVDGIIVARTYRDDPRIQYLKSIDHPFVVSGRAEPEQASDFPYIDVDSQAGICMLVEHFIDYGHRHIGLILPPEHIAFTGFRYNGYREGLETAGIPLRPEYIRQGDLRRDSGYNAANSLLTENPEITAIVVCNDLMALGAMGAIRQQNKRIGLDIALGGFDDIPAARHTSPSLTTIHQPIFEIGERLTRLLLKIIMQDNPQNIGQILPCKLMIRDSSGTRKT